MSKKFNLKRYKELLKLNESDKISFMDPNFFELLDYSTSISEQLRYERKKDYFLLVENYLDGTLSLMEFRTQFLKMEREDAQKGEMILQNLQELEVFYLAEDLEKFSRLISNITGICADYFVLQPIPEADFYLAVHEYYSELQKAFPV